MTNTEEICDSSAENSNGAVEQIQVFSDTECFEIRKVIYELQHLWIARNRFAPFYTLGAASYMDGFILQIYLKLAQKFNSILREQLEWMYQKLFEALEESLQGKVSFAERFAVPGFHVILNHPVFKKDFASLHFDLQYDFLFKNNETADFSRPISFTLAIALPSTGASLQMWDLHYEEAKNTKREHLPYLAEKRKKSFVAYKKGCMVVHSGHHLHQIAPMKELQPNEERITLQGHAILCDGIWQVYW